MPEYKLTATISTTDYEREELEVTIRDAINDVLDLKAAVITSLSVEPAEPEDRGPDGALA